MQSTNYMISFIKYTTCTALVSYPDPCITATHYTVSDNAYVRLGLGTRLVQHIIAEIIYRLSLIIAFTAFGSLYHGYVSISLTIYRRLVGESD